MTYTYAILDVSRSTYEEIRSKLDAAGYQHAFHTHEGEETAVIDMHGIGLRQDPADDGRSLGAIIRKALPVANLQLLPETVTGAQVVKARKGQPPMTRVTFVTGAENLTPGHIAYPKSAPNVGIVIWVPKEIYEP